MSNPYAVDLPAAPDLAQQRKRAKDFLKAVRVGDGEALARFRYGHPRYANSADDIICRDAQLSDAQWVIAREYGFTSWPRLKRHIEELDGNAEPCRPFETELGYYRDRAAGMLSVHRTGERNALRLVRQFHPAFRGASETDIRAAALTQADTELILAREHGFPTWDAFAQHIAALAKGGRSGPSVRASRRSAPTISTPSRRCSRRTRTSSTPRAPTATACCRWRCHSSGTTCSRRCSRPVPIPTCRTTRAGRRCTPRLTRIRKAIRPRSPSWSICWLLAHRCMPKPMATVARRSWSRCSGVTSRSPSAWRRRR